MIIIENGTMWNGKRDDLPSIRTIVIEGQLLKQIFTQDRQFPLPKEVERIDASSKFILPGLINCHTHLCCDGGPNPRSTLLNDGVPRVSMKASEAAKKILRYGITTVRDLGGFRGVDIALRDAIRDGIVTGPRMLVSGEAICMTGGHLHFAGCEVDGPDEARKGARRQLKSNVDLIKVMATGGITTQTTEPGASQLTVAEMKAVVEEAEKASRRVACHAHGNGGILNALSAGVHTIEHCTYLDEKAADLMAEHKVYCTPTLIALKRIIDKGTEGGIPEFAVHKARELIRHRIKSFHLAYARKIDILVGADSGSFMNPHGDLVDELLILQKEGMTAVEVLASATSVAATALGINDQLGTIEEGKIADLVIVDGNPLDDLCALRKISLIMKGGKKIIPE